MQHPYILTLGRCRYKKLNIIATPSNSFLPNMDIEVQQMLRKSSRSRFTGDIITHREVYES